MRRFAKAASMAALAACVTAAAALAEDRALLIGISAYSGDATPLAGTANDLALMTDVAQRAFGFDWTQVKILADEMATRENVLAAFDDWLIAGTQPGDRVFIFYAGHGMQIQDEPGGDEGQEGMDEALVMVDFTYSNAQAGVIIDDEIQHLIRQIRDRRVTIFVDSCHSGTVSRSLSGQPVHPQKRARFMPPALRRGHDTSLSLASRSGESLRRDVGLFDDQNVAASNTVEVWSAAASYQLAWETNIQGTNHGVFSWTMADALLNGSADRNGNGRTSREELLSHVGAATEAFCMSDPDCRSRGFTPQLEAPAGARVLSVIEWPEDNPGPVTAPSVAEMLDLLTGGRRDVQLSMTHLDPQKSGPVRAGDRVAFEVASARSGDLLLFDLRDGGVVHQLYPSDAFAKNTGARANETLRIPDAYSRVEFAIPPGAGTLVALVVNDRGLVDRLRQENVSLQAIPNPMSFFGRVMQELNGTWHGDAENRKVDFGMATLPYAL